MKGEILGLLLMFAVVFWTPNLQVCRSHHATCDRVYSNVDCIDTYQNNKRIYNELIITDRDMRSPKASGIPTDWFHWEEYLLGLACRCLERLNRLSDGNLSIYNQFTIENYGECWSSRHGYDSLHILTRSNNCIGAGYLECQSSSMSECTGIQLSSFLYQIHNRTKLLDEHCHIVKRIVCPSSTVPVLQNSSTLFLENATVFGNFTNSWQNTASQVLRNLTMSINATSVRQYTTSQVLENSTVLKNVNTSHYTYSQMPSSTIWFMGSRSSTRLQTSSMYTPFKESTSKKFSNQTDSMLSQLQTLNTGQLYTSGSKLPNVTLAPTQFFITGSIRYTTATAELSNVESTKPYSNHSSSLNSAGSSQTSVSTTSNAERLTSKSYYISKDTSSITRFSAANRETTLQTSRLNFALSSINTSPIEETPILISRSIFQQNLSTSESTNQIVSTLPDTMLSSALSRQLNITSTTTSNVIAKLYQSNTSGYISTTQIIHDHLPVEIVEKSTEVPQVPQSSSIISTKIHIPENSTSSRDMLSTVLSGKLTQFIQPSLPWNSNASGLISTSSFSKSFKDPRNYSSITQSTHMNVVLSSRSSVNETIFTSSIKESSTKYLQSVYPATMLNKTPTSLYVHLSLLLEETLTMQRSASNQIKASYDTSKANTPISSTSIFKDSTSYLTSTPINVRSSLPLEETFTSSQIKASYETSKANKPISSTSIFKNYTSDLTSTPINVHSSLPLQGTTSTTPRSISSQIKASSEITVSSQPERIPSISNSKTVTPREGKQNSAGTQLSTIFTVMVVMPLCLFLLPIFLFE